MRLARLAVLAIAAVCSLPAIASADGYYLGESYGGVHVGDQLGSHIKDGAFRIQFQMGVRRGHWALEAAATADLNLSFDDRSGPNGWQPGPDPNTSLSTFNMSLKYIAPLSRHLDVYLRGGPSYGWLAGGGLDNFRGRGLGGGAGISLHGKVPVIGLLAWPLFFTNWGPKMNGALYIDDGYDFFRFHEGGNLHASSIDGSVSHITMGFAFGTDF